MVSAQSNKSNSHNTFGIHLYYFYGPKNQNAEYHCLLCHYKKHSYLNDSGAKKETLFYRPMFCNTGFGYYDNNTF